MPIKTQSALINPYELPRNEDLSAAERLFMRCVKDGDPCHIGMPRPIKIPPLNVKAPPLNVRRPEGVVTDGEKANTIRANVIGFFASGGSTEHPMRGNIIRLQGAWVPDALDLDHISSPCTLSLQNCHFAAPIRMAHSEFPFLQLDGSLLAGGLQGDGMRITGPLFMGKGFSAESEVCLADANIGGCLFCEEGKFKKGEDQDARAAIVADRITVGGNMSLDNGFFAEGEVRIPAAKIGSDLYCDKGNFNGGIFAKSAKIKNRLSLYGVRGHGAIDLSFASADVLADDEQSRQKFFFNLDEFSYARLAKPASIQSRINWLSQRPAGVKFSPQPFEQAAKVLFSMGRDNDAREILLEKEQWVTGLRKTFSWRKIKQWCRIARMCCFPPPKKRRRFLRFLVRTSWDSVVNSAWKVLRRGWEYLAGYGYRLRRTLVAPAVVVIFGWGVFFFADYCGHIVPHQPLIIARLNDHAGLDNVWERQECQRDDPRPTKVVECIFPEYPRFNALLYSADVFIPFFALHQESYWYPQPRSIFAAFFFKLWYWFEIAAGWILTSLLVLSITGLLRPRQSSGDKE